MQNYSCSIIFPCCSPNCALVMTCTGIAAIASLLQQLSFCGYNILLAAIASPVHTCPLLLIYLSGTFLFVILVALFLKSIQNLKYGWIQACFILALIVIVIAIFAAILTALIEFITLVAVHSTGNGILSVVGSLLPTVVLTALGYLGQRLLETISTKDEFKETTYCMMNT